MIRKIWEVVHMSIRSRKYNIAVFAAMLIMCVSYLGTGGLYNPNIRNYAAHSVSSLGERRGIDTGSSDMLMIDSASGLMQQTRNIRSGGSEPSAQDAGMMSAVIAALLLGLIQCVWTFSGRHAAIRHSRRWILLEYIHKKDGKKRSFTGVLISMNQ